MSRTVKRQRPEPRCVAVPYEAMEDPAAIGWQLNGEVASIPLPHYRRYSGPRATEKRPVSVNCYVWWNVGGSHHYVDVREDHDSIYHQGGVAPYDREPKWVDARDDADGKGRTWHLRLATRLEAEVAVAQIVDEHFPATTHVVEYKWPDEEPISSRLRKYQREGD